MGWRFYRRVRVLPGISVNVSKSGPSLTIGGRGAHVTIGKRGITRTVGIPGTGIYYTSRHGYHTGIHRSSETGAANGWMVIVASVGALALLALVSR